MGQLLEIPVPDIGEFDEVEVVEILVAKGDRVEFEDPLVSIESDKATMEIPSSSAGVVVELRVVEGDRVSEGSVLVVLDAEDASDGDEAAEVEEASSGRPSKHDASASSPAAPGPAAAIESASRPEPVESAPMGRESSSPAANPVPDRFGLPHASPLVRRYARELGVPLGQAEGSGSHGRVLVDDLRRQVRERFSSDAAGSGVGSGIPRMPAVDHASFGPIREEKLTRIQKVSGPNLQRSWSTVPHVTHHDEADVTQLEGFRRDRRDAAAARGLKLSPLLFVMKAAVLALSEFPTFRSSLHSEGDRLVIKEYFHFGIAVDTDQGLVVPVIRDVDRKGIFELADELNGTAERARTRKLGPDDLRGACFTISSLGGIGGTGFSPIVNAPEVAILGLSKTRVQAQWHGPSPLDLIDAAAVRESGSAAALELGSHGEGGPANPASVGHFVPRLILPFSVSYDHRVVDGALAARFAARLAGLLEEPLQLLL